MSGIIKCPLCGRGLVGTYSRKELKKNGSTKIRYFYRCGHGKVAEDGSRCTYSPSLNEKLLNEEIEGLLLDMTKSPEIRERLLATISQKVDLSSFEAERERMRQQLKQTTGSRTKLISMIENLDVTDRHYEKKLNDMQERLDVIYDKISEYEEIISNITQKIDGVHKNELNAQAMFKILENYGTLYQKMTDQEKKLFFAQFIEKIELYPDENDVHKCIKSVKLMFPITIECERNGKKGLNNETTVETVVLLS